MPAQQVPVSHPEEEVSVLLVQVLQEQWQPVPEVRGPFLAEPAAGPGQAEQERPAWAAWRSEAVPEARFLPGTEPTTH